MPARIILVRHGQTEWNREDRFRGRADISLNDVGFRQAEATASRLAELGVTAVYISPIRRAMQTAEAAARRLGLEQIPLPGVTDAEFGKWQGLTLKDAEQQYPEIFRQWFSTPEIVRFPGGESVEDIRRRAESAVDQLLVKHSAESVVVVTHAVTCRLLTLHFLDLDTHHFWNVRHDNCAISIFESRDGLTVATTLNDVCHLGQSI